MQFKCKKCGALYVGEEEPAGLECTCECTNFEIEQPLEFEKESN